MVTYRKERNFIYFNIDGKGEYRLDINTGEFLGLKGKPIKSIPSIREMRSTLYPYDGRIQANHNLLRYIYNILLYHSCPTQQFIRDMKLLKTADQVDSLTRHDFHLDTNELQEIADNFNSFVKWWNSKPETTSVGAFRRWIFREKFSAYTTIFNNDQWAWLRGNCPNITIEQMELYAYYTTKCKVWDYDGDYSHVAVYLEMCKDMGKKPEKASNFMREYVETYKEYILRKTEYDNRKLCANYAKHSKAWEFEYGDFVVVIPTCTTDIIDEGRNMHHCVGNYVERVVGGNTFICFVRHKATPDKCYITCQVSTEGDIQQYFLAFDRYISTEEDIAFKREFQRYLNKVWAE